MSKLSSAPRCTPPMPPVAKIVIPLRCAIATVAETVVTPAGRRCEIAAGRSRSASLTEALRRRSSSLGSTPAMSVPSRSPVRAGTAPSARMAAFTRSKHLRLWGAGSPRFDVMVDSSATTARPDARASATSCESLTCTSSPLVLLQMCARRTMTLVQGILP